MLLGNNSFTASTIPFCLSEMNVRGSLCLMRYGLRTLRNLLQESKCSPVAMKMAMRNKPLLSSNPMTDRTFPLYFPFKKQPSNPRSGLHPFSHPSKDALNDTNFLSYGHLNHCTTLPGFFVNIYFASSRHNLYPSL